jgi:ATP-dependent protease Clp ATPase subunit
LTDCGAEEIAAACFEDKTGARGLGGMLERTLRDFKFELGGRYQDKTIDVVIDREVVRDPKGGLDRILKELAI